MLRRVAVTLALFGSFAIAQVDSGPQAANPQNTSPSNPSSLPSSQTQAPSSATQNTVAPSENQAPTAEAPPRIITPDMLAKMTPEECEKLGDELRAKKEYLQALDAFNAALAKRPKSAVILNKIGMTYLSTGQLPKAKKSLEQALKIDKKYPEAHNNLGVVFYVMKKYGPAIKHYRRALALKEDSASFHSNLGTVYLQKNEYEKGFAEYRRAYELDPSVFERSSSVGVAARMAGPEDRARFNFMMAKMYAEAGDLDHALLCLRKSLEDGYKDIDEVYKQQEFAKLREDQRFAELMAERPPSLPQ